jgi:hypothetical protein
MRVNHAKCPNAPFGFPDKIRSAGVRWDSTVKFDHKANAKAFTDWKEFERPRLSSKPIDERDRFLEDVRLRWDKSRLSHDISLS